MREKLSKETKQQVQAIEQIEYYAKRREQSELARGATGNDVADSMIASYEAEMRKIADKNGLDLEKVLTGLENKDTVKKHGSSEQAKKEALSELKKLETKYGKTKAVLYSSYDYHHQALMQGILDTIQEEVKGITKEQGITDPELFKKFDLPDPEKVKEGHAKLDQLEIEKKNLEIDAIKKSLEKSPESLLGLVRLREEAEKIIKEYKLNPSHLSRFAVPEIPEEKVEVIEEKISAQKEEPENLDYKNGKKVSWFKLMLGLEDKEEKDKKRYEAERKQVLEAIKRADQKINELRDHMPKDPSSPFAKDLAKNIEKLEQSKIEANMRLKPEDRNPSLIVSGIEKNTPPLNLPLNTEGEVIPESNWEKLKRVGRKLFTGALFTASTLSPKSTTDSHLPPQEGKRVVYENTVQQKTPEQKNERTIEYKTPDTKSEIQKIQPETPIKKEVTPTTEVRQKIEIGKITPATLHEIETPVMAEMINQIQLDTAGTIDTTVAQTPKSDTAETVVFAPVKQSVEKITPAGLKTIEIESQKPQTLKELIQKIDSAEKHAPQVKKLKQKINIEKINPIEIKQTIKENLPPVAKEAIVPEIHIPENVVRKDAIEKITPTGLKTIEIKSTTPETLKELVQKIDLEEKHRVDIKKITPAPLITQENTISSEAPKVRKIIEDQKPAIKATDIISQYEEGADTIKYEEPKTGTPGIKIGYLDEKGNKLDTNAIQRTRTVLPSSREEIPMIAPTKMDTVRVPTVTIRPATETSVIRTENENGVLENTIITPGPIGLAISPEITRDTPSARIDTLESTEPRILEIRNRQLNSAGGVKWDWNIMESSSGYELDPIETPTASQLQGTEFQIIDPEIIRAEGGYIIPHFLWERMDPAIWHALQENPGALEIYLTNSKNQGTHDPYTIQVWNGDTGMEYLISSNNMLIKMESRSRSNEALFGRFMTAVEESVNGYKLSINNIDINKYERLSEAQKTLLAKACLKNDKKTFVTYSIDSRTLADGSIKKFNMRTAEMETAQPEEIKREIQDMIDFVRTNDRVTEKLLIVGKNNKEQGWKRMYSKRPTGQIKEIHTQEKRIEKKKTFIRKILKKANRPKTKKNKQKRESAETLQYTDYSTQ